MQTFGDGQSELPTQSDPASSRPAARLDGGADARGVDAGLAGRAVAVLAALRDARAKYMQISSGDWQSEL